FHVEPPAFKIRENSTYEHLSFSGGLPGELRSKAWHRISASDKENIQTRRRCKVLAGIMSNDPV
ncbi:hypothetical protein, partial [Escherichia coli]|uniref:hypothetical protein n=1 Tax=Escherichia coli TaxID=562 RepID=UPI001BEC912A